MTRREVSIHGAGLSGLVAAINLAREGHRVTVHDREPRWGGSPAYNPSAHTTSIRLEQVSRYVGIDVAPAFRPLVEFPIYLGDTRVDFPVDGIYAVERGDRPGSLDALLYPLAVELGVRFEYGSHLTAERLASLEPGSIIACGLAPEAYHLLGIPHRRWYGWMSRGACDDQGLAWIWLGEGVTEYGYLSATNGRYLDLLFSAAPPGEAALRRYREAMRRARGVEHGGWEEVGGVVPLAVADNPRLVRQGLVCCGTIAGFMDPLGWFGINGALVSGRIAAMAVTDLPAAEREFARFSRNFRRAFLLKERLWYPLLRPRVGLLERAVKLAGPRRVERWLARAIRADRHLPLFAIPGFSHLGTCYSSAGPGEPGAAPPGGGGRVPGRAPR